MIFFLECFWKITSKLKITQRVIVISISYKVSGGPEKLHWRELSKQGKKRKFK